MAEIRILAIDGGGIRGLIPAVVLEHIEARANRPISDLFHLIAGTSTGGILATALSADKQGTPFAPAARLRTLYEKRGQRIFRRSLWKRLESGGGLLGEKYDSRFLRDEVAGVVGEALLSDVGTDLIVTTYDIEDRTPHFFKSWRARGETRDVIPGFSDPQATAKDRDFRLADVAVATSSVPAFFEPVSALAASGRETCLVDGGVFANNPAMCGYSAARRIYHASHDIYLVSLGTGKLERRIQCEDAEDWGVVEWLRPLIDVVFDGMSDVTNYHLKLLLNSDFERVQIDLKNRPGQSIPPPSDDFDDASAENIARLVARGELLLDERKSQIDGIIERLLSQPKAKRTALLRSARR